MAPGASAFQAATVSLFFASAAAAATTTTAATAAAAAADDGLSTSAHTRRDSVPSF
jgi:hypothetical protein